MDFTTSRNPLGAVTTSTPGHGGSGDNFGDLIGSILQGKRSQAQVAQAAPPSALPRLGYPVQSPQARAPMPQLGSQAVAPAKQKAITRVRTAPRNPMADYSSTWTGLSGDQGHTNRTVVERFIPGVGWEFEGLPEYNPKGGGSFVGGGTGVTLPSTPALDPRMLALTSQSRMSNRG
jgi:hypothetical protein